MEAAASGAETSAASSAASTCALYDASIDDASIKEVAGFAGDLGASLQEALAIETSSGTHGVCAEEEVSLLDVVGGEDGVRRDTTATPSGNSACNDLQLANADTSAPPPAGAAPPVHAKSARSAEEISKLHERLNGLVFSNQEDGSGEYGEKTWRHAFAMVQEAVGCGYALQMNKKSKLLKKDDESASGRRNRYNCVQIKCVHSGQPRATAKTADTYARKKTSTKKFGCNWGLSLYWGANSNAPSLGKDLCLWHTYEGSEGMEHDPPREIENEMTMEDLQAEAVTIKKMHEKGVNTASIYKYLQEMGKRLGDKGKQMLRIMRANFDRDKQNSRGGLNDAQEFLRQLEEDGAFKHFKLDEENRLMDIAWAHEDQQRNAEKYFPIIVSDTTFNTTRLTTSWHS
eukprot:g11945.t1